MLVGAAASQPELETTGRCKTREQPCALCASPTACRCHSPSEQGWGLPTITRVFLLQALLQGRVLGLWVKLGGAGEWVLSPPHAQLLHGSLGSHPWLSASHGGSVPPTCRGQRLCLLWHRGGVRGRGGDCAGGQRRLPAAGGRLSRGRQLTFWKEIAALCSFL